MLINKNEAKEYHKLTLQVLEKTGIAIGHSEARKLLIQNGAREDDVGRILIPAEMVENALKDALRNFTIYDRDGNPAMEMKQGPTYFGTGPDSLYQRDLYTDQIRESRLDDVRLNARLTDALGFDFMMSMTLPRELPNHLLYPSLFSEMVINSPRPILMCFVSIEDLKHIHSIAKIVAGDRINRAPFYMPHLDPLAPLIFDRSCVEKLFFTVDHDLPFIFAASDVCGIMGPVTAEGNVIQGSAECLAGLVLARLRNPNAKYIYGGIGSGADMQTGLATYGSNEWARTTALYAALAKFYDLPAYGTAGCTDSRDVDAQASWEAYRSILYVLQAGSTLVHDVGYMSLGELYDPKMLVLTAELIRDARHLIHPVDIKRAEESVSVIDEVARGSLCYLTHPHTKKNFRKSMYFSKMLDRSKLHQNCYPMRARLQNEAKRILARHTPVPLDERIEKAVMGYVEGILD